ncbi:MAG: hypothetical protein ACJ8H8_11610 [Geminicoccaceae bacterium]
MTKSRDAPLARTLMVLVAKLMHAQAELLDYRLDPATEPPASKYSPSPPFPALHPLLVVAGHELDDAAKTINAAELLGSALPLSRFFYDMAQRHRAALAQIITACPRCDPEGDAVLAIYTASLQEAARELARAGDRSTCRRVAT